MIVKEIMLIGKLNSKEMVLMEDLPTYMQADDYVYSLAIDSNGDIYAQGNGIELISEGSHYDWWIKKWV
jgi:hypothetical protein